MDPSTIIAVTFPYPIRTYHSQQNPQDAVVEHIRGLCEATGAAHGCYVMVVPPEATVRSQGPVEVDLSIGVVGLVEGVAKVRGALLREMPSHTLITIKASRLTVLDANAEMRPELKRKLDNIMQQTKTQITCVGGNYNSSPMPPPGLAGASGVSDLQKESIELEVVGRWEDVERARMASLVLLDEMAGLHAEPFDLDPQLHPLLAGRKACILETVMHDTMTNIYMPTPFVYGADASYPRTIWITGRPEGVMSARDRLSRMGQQRSTMVQSKRLNILPRKLDWMLMNCKQTLRKIMRDNATYIGIPPLGTNTNHLVIVGDDRVYLERSCRAIMHMVCDFYVAGIQLGTPAINQPTPAPILSPLMHLINPLCRISQQTRAEVVIQKQYIEIYGLEAAVKSAYQAVSTLDTLRTLSIRDTKFQLELALEHREFINGKKNGKINKIVKASGCKVTFQENFSDYNMLIDLYNTIPSKALEGLALLEDEMPAEISFYVPEAFHKRIIGVGGKNIQRIMKKYAVYVKFSNAEEFAHLGGYFENMDNVIARTPMKNSANLDLLKQSIMELIVMGEKNKVTTTLPIPRQLHRLVVGPRGMLLNELMKVTKVEVALPEKESGKDDITIQGAEPNVQAAMERLRSLVPDVEVFSIPATPAAWMAIQSPEMKSAINRIGHEWGIDIYYHMTPLEETGPSECTFLMFFVRPFAQGVEPAKNMIMECLGSKNVPLQKPGGLPRTDSYKNLQPQRSFDFSQHFPSKLLAGVSSGADTPNHAVASGFGGLFEGAFASSNVVSAGMTRNTQFAHSSPDLRRHFEEVGGPDRQGAVTPSHNMPGEMKRSSSDLNQVNTNILAATLAATSLGPTSLPLGGWGPSAHQGQNYPPSRRAPLQLPDPIATGGHEDLEHDMDPSTDPELLKGFAGMLSPIDAPERPGGQLGVRVPNDKFCGLKLSRSMGVINERSRSRLMQDTRPGPGPSHLRDEVETDTEEEDYGPFSPTMITHLFDIEASNPKSYEPVKLFFRALELEQFIPIFTQEEVDFGTLLMLEENELKDIGVSTFGSRKKIMNAIRECRKFFANKGGQISAPSSPRQSPNLGGNTGGSDAGSKATSPARPLVYSPSPRSSAYAPSPSRSGGSSAGSSMSSPQHQQQHQQRPGQSPQQSFGAGAPAGQRKGYGHYIYTTDAASPKLSRASTGLKSFNGSTTGSGLATPNGLHSVSPVLQSGPGLQTRELAVNSESDEHGVVVRGIGSPERFEGGSGGLALESSHVYEVGKREDGRRAKERPRSTAAATASAGGLEWRTS